jgi:hypothetical protein
MTKEKIYSAIQILNGTKPLFELTVRFELIYNSFTAFLKSPIFGVGAYYNDFSIIGGHSQFFDELGRFGLLGFVPLCVTFVISLKNSQAKNLSYILGFAFLMISLINPSFVYMILFNLLVIPNIYLLSIRKKVIYENSIFA